MCFRFSLTSSPGMAHSREPKPFAILGRSFEPHDANANLRDGTRLCCCLWLTWIYRDLLMNSRAVGVSQRCFSSLQQSACHKTLCMPEEMQIHLLCAAPTKYLHPSVALRT